MLSMPCQLRKATFCTMQKQTVQLFVTLLLCGITLTSCLKSFTLPSLPIPGQPRRLSEGSNGDMGGPDVIYPPKAWAWQRATPKTSLQDSQKDPAPAWMLNIIETAHWVSFPIGFHIAYFLFANASVLARGTLKGNMFGIFLIMLGILNQVFGGGMAVLMHVYEGWMVCPFRNLLILPASPSDKQVDSVRVPNYNNAWLRAAAYQMLMSFQSFGLSLFTMGVFGVKAWTVLLVSGTVFISLIGPKEPRLTLTRTVKDASGKEEKLPVLPLSISLLLVLIINVVLQLLASIKLFYPAMRSASPAGSLAVILAVVASILPSSLQGAGGGIEGYFAESSFKQWQHLLAFAILLSGFLMLDAAFHHLAAFNALHPPAASPTTALPAAIAWLVNSM